MEAASENSRKRWSRPNNSSESSNYGFTRFRERSFKSSSGSSPRWAACSQRVRTIR